MEVIEEIKYRTDYYNQRIKEFRAKAEQAKFQKNRFEEVHCANMVLLYKSLRDELDWVIKIMGDQPCH